MDETNIAIKKWLGNGSINVFGVPFAGKDTQAKVLAKKLNAEVISSGELLRKNKDNPKLQAALASGQNVPSELFFEIVLPYLKSPRLSNKPLVLSEMGRKNFAEVEGTIQVTNDSGHPQKAVIFLSVTEEEVWKRFRQSKQVGDRGKRNDDNEKALQIRLDKFKQEIEPVINYYRKLGLLIEINGSKSREEVASEIINQLHLKTLQ